ncbi:MAG: XrtA-associated tyrosine autokinase [Gammaproteobacteria bacterium]|nr:XrtA-associated tyrosine autokinase [Gammaproteobacteria bacterium]
MNTIEKALQKNRQNKVQGAQTGESESNSIVSRQSAVATGKRQTKKEVQIDLERLEAAGMLTTKNGRSRIAEEMRAIKRPLLRNAFSNSGKVNDRGNLIMVTSAVPGEGKSFNSINLAMSISMELDRKVLLIDADVAKPSAMKYLGLDTDVGLVDYLLDDDLELSDVLLNTNVENLRLLPAGRLHSHATEVLASESMYNLTMELSERYPDRVVIFDSPPLLATSEARVLAGLMGQILVVVESVKTAEPVIKEALSYLNTDQQTVGLVLNKFRGKSSGNYYGSYYGYGAYGAKDKE